MMAPQMFRPLCSNAEEEEAETLRLLILIYRASKKLFLVPYVIQCYHSNDFVREYLRFSEVIVSYVSL